MKLLSDKGESNWTVTGMFGAGRPVRVSRMWQVMGGLVAVILSVLGAGLEAWRCDAIEVNRSVGEDGGIGSLRDQLSDM